MLKKITAALLLLTSTSVFSGWIDPGAAYQCDRGRQAFRLVSTMDTSSPEEPGTVRAPPGFKELRMGSRTVKCAVGSAKVTAEIVIRPGRGTGTGGGLTSISVEALLVNGKRIFETPELFNHYYLEPLALHSIDIEAEGRGGKVGICKAEWHPDIGYYNVQCEIRNV